ncbi:hypothetical protein [Streptomyces sp. NPDC002537]
MTPPSGKWLSQALLVPTRGWWLRGDPVQVLTGVLFDAVQIPAETIRSQAASDDRDAVEAVFRKSAIDNAVIAEPPPYGWYFALVPPGTAREWGAPYECLGLSHTVTVPPPHRAGPPGIHWLLPPPDSAASLCDPERVVALRSGTRARSGDQGPCRRPTSGRVSPSPRHDRPGRHRPAGPRRLVLRPVSALG